MIPSKRAATVINIVLLIAVLVVSIIVMFSLQKIFNWQARAVETDTASAIVEMIQIEIERVLQKREDTDFSISIPYAVDYKANISQGKITMEFLESDISVKKNFIIPNSHVLPSEFESAGTVHIYKFGRTILVTNNLTCEPLDQRCDPGCAVLGICDRQCYRDNTVDFVCNQICIDTNNDGKSDGRDADGICDPDCYDNEKGGFYFDIDCMRTDDGICDPDTHNVRDGFCDTDCAGTNGVCDVDCTAILGAFDADCTHRRNGACETQLGENCLFYPEDCDCGAGRACKYGCAKDPPYTFDPDGWGCVPAAENVGTGLECASSCQCGGDDRCDHTGHCCPEETYFNGATCVRYDSDGTCTTDDPLFPAETCLTSTMDCLCATDPDNPVCCPGAITGTKDGCAPKIDEGASAEPCWCDGQCSGQDKCKNNHCCGPGYIWDDVAGVCVLDPSGCEIPEQAQFPGCNCQKMPSLCSGGQVCCASGPNLNEDTLCSDGSGNKGTGEGCDCGTECSSGICSPIPRYSRCVPTRWYHCRGSDCQLEFVEDVTINIADPTAFGLNCDDHNTLDNFVRNAAGYEETDPMTGAVTRPYSALDACLPLSDGIICNIQNTGGDICYATQGNPLNHWERHFPNDWEVNYWD
ncbi:MAG: hypothetical protein ABIC95_06330 [archaeon]